jgi:hypothetical protein
MLIGPFGLNDVRCACKCKNSKYVIFYDGRVLCLNTVEEFTTALLTIELLTGDEGLVSEILNEILRRVHH